MIVCIYVELMAYVISCVFDILRNHYFFLFFFFNDTATTEIYTLSLHDALPISRGNQHGQGQLNSQRRHRQRETDRDRKSTRLNSSHLVISYAVFCLKKKKNTVTVPI